MAGIFWKAQTAEITSGTTVKTLLQVASGAAVNLMVKEIIVSFKGTVNTDAPILVEVLKQTSGGTMTSLTVRKTNNNAASLSMTASHTATAEPTDSGAVFDRQEVHPQGGRYYWVPPNNSPGLEVAAGERLGLRVTAGVSVSAICSFAGEE